MLTAINPDNVRLFHITALENLPAILAAGCLQAKNVLEMKACVYTSIAHATIQSRRATKAVFVGVGGQLHDYVPFYFAPRSPMLLTIEGGNVAGFTSGQAGVVTLETTVNRAIHHNSIGFVFYDLNASLDYSRAFDSLQDLDKIAWDLLTEIPQLDGFCKWWNNRDDDPRYAQRKEKRMAEFLVHQQVPLSAITSIGVADHTALETLRLMLTNSPLQSLIAVRRDWYY